MGMRLEPNKRPRKKLVPQRLSEKLWYIRFAYNLTQAEMLCIVNEFETGVNRARINQYETGKRAPSLVEVANYALFAKLPLETLFNDAVDLPARLRQAGNEELKRRGQPAGSKSKRRKEKNAEDTGDNSGNQLEVKGSEPQGYSSSDESSLDESLQPVPNEASQTAENTATDSPADDVAVTNLTDAYYMPLSKETEQECKTIYLKLLEDVPFNKISQFPPGKFIEQMFAVALNDHHARGAESAIAHRIRLFLAAKSGG